MKKLDIRKLSNKKKIGVLSAILVVAIAVIVVIAKQSLADTNSSILRNQTVSGISFENAKIEKKNGKNVFTVDLYNENEDKYEIDNLTFIFKQDKGKDIEVYLDDVDGLESLEGRQISVVVEGNITKSSDIKYIINK